MRNVIFLLPPLLLLAYAALPVEAQDVARQSFLEDLSNVFLGDTKPVTAGEGNGWKGIVLCTPGSSLSPLLSAYDPSNYETLSTSQALQNSALYDSVLLVRDGVGYLGQENVATVWDRILVWSRPAGDVTSELLSLPQTAAILLFKTTDAVDRARGIAFEREPSRFMQRYREYELLYRMISISQSRDDGSWRLHPRLAGFSSLDEAKEQLGQDWIKYGFKTEIEAAEAAFFSGSNRKWLDWTGARARYNAEQFNINTYTSLSRTFLFPPPSAWIGMSSWIWVNGHVPGIDGEASCQMARVSVVRPWFDMPLLLNGRLVIRKSLAESENVTLSDGSPPSLLAYPKGRLSTFVEELLIVRHIQFSTDAIRRVHPLGRFVYPEATNLVGYICRIMPEIKIED